MVKDILSGKCDSELSQISEAIRLRKEQLAQISFFDFKVGDKVKFNSQTRPGYLIGCEAIITEKKQKKVVVNLVKPPIGSRFSNNIRTSVTLLEKA